MTPAREPPTVCVWTMATAGLDEAAVQPWRCELDTEERARADRFVFAHSRIAFIAAHALARSALAAAAGAAPGDFRFVPGPYGKPTAWLHGRAPDLSFSLSHTDGMVGVAVARPAGLPAGLQD